MSNENKKRTADEAVLMAFSVEPEHDVATLQRYLAKYPHLTSDLLDLSMELQLSNLDDAESDGDLATQDLDRSWAIFNEMLTEGARELSAEEARSIESSFMSPAMREIGLPISALQAIKSGGVLSEGFPARWLTKIASVGDVAADRLRRYLDRPSRLSPSVSYKSDGKPAAGEKVSFRELIASADLTDREKAEILREE